MSFFDSLKFALNNNPFEGSYRINRMRPPGAVNEKLFMKLCVRCARCIEVCPYRCLKRSKDLKNGEIGTPFIYPEETGCQLCMKCTSVCPTGAIDPSITEPGQVAVGKARIDEETCNNFRYARQESGQDEPDGTASICNSCFNVCPLRYDAIYLEDGILPTITEKCTGCGLCVERCPTKPKSVSVIPKDMPDAGDAGYFNYLKRIEEKQRRK